MFIPNVLVPAPVSEVRPDTEQPCALLGRPGQATASTCSCVLESRCGTASTSFEWKLSSLDVWTLSSKRNF